MSEAPTRTEQVAALAWVLVAERTTRILTLVAPPLGEITSRRFAWLSGLPRHERVIALSKALDGCSQPVGRREVTLRDALVRRLFRDAQILPAAPRAGRQERLASGGDCRTRAPGDRGRVARSVICEHGMETFPFELARVTRGFTEVSRCARVTGARAGELISAALSSVLGDEVRVEGRPVVGAAHGCAGVAAVALALPGVSGTGLVEVDAALLARVLGRALRAGGGVPAALSATNLERSLLAVLSLVAIEAASSPALDALAPRVILDDPPGPEGGAALVADDLLVALDIRIGPDRGPGQLRLPAAAVRALGTGPVEPGPAGLLGLGGSLREGVVTLAADDLAALGCGDVLLLDEGPRHAELVLPGGLTLRGRAGTGVFDVEEIRMSEARAAYPLTLSVEIARVTVTLGELARLEPGAAIAIDARKDGAVVLRAGEHVIARGHLVEVQGALGVRIAQLGALP